MEDIALVCEAFINIIDELIFDRAFNKKIKLSKRLPFIIIYVLILLGLLSLLIFIGINLVIKRSLFGYLFLLMSLLILFLLIYPFLFYKKRLNRKYK